MDLELLKCSLYGCSFEGSLEAARGTECSSLFTVRESRQDNIICKALPGTAPQYLWEHLLQVESIPDYLAQKTVWVPSREIRGQSYNVLLFKLGSSILCKPYLWRSRWHPCLQFSGAKQSAWVAFISAEGYRRAEKSLWCHFFKEVWLYGF